MANQEKEIQKIDAIVQKMEFNVFSMQRLQKLVDRYIELYPEPNIIDQLINILKKQIDLDSQMVAIENGKELADTYKKKAMEIMLNAEKKIQ